MGRTSRDMTCLRVSPCPCVSSGMCAWCAGCMMEGTFSTPRIFESIFSRPQAMSAETHIRLAEPFRPCAKSERHFNGLTTIHGATTEDFDEDPWMTVVPCRDAHLDDWSEGNWASMESHCPWASQYKFANMLEFGDLIPLPDAVLGHKFLNHMRKALSCISRYFSCLDCHNVRSSPRTWGGSRKQELVDCARRCSFLDQYLLRAPGISPRAVSYCCVRLTVSGSDFARVLCVAASNKSRKLVDAVVLVSRNEVVIEGSKFVPMRGPERVDGWPDLVIADASRKEFILMEFEKQGMDASLRDGSRKLVVDAPVYKDCPPYMGCEDEKTIKATEKLAQNKKLSTDWKNKVLSVLTGSRAKSMEVALAEGVVHVLWKDTGEVTSIAPFGVDPLEAQLRVAELEKAVGTTKCHTCVLDLCEPVDFELWTPKAFESLNSLLEQLFPSHWTVVAFVPRQWDYSFMTRMRHLVVVKAMAGKWVRRTQQKKSFAVGNNLYSADDRMYILCKGDDLRENTCVIYDARLSAGDAAAVGVHQKVTPTDISETPFDPCEWTSAMLGVDRKVYKDMEQNPAQLAHLLEFLCKKGEGVMFLGKPHARVVWEVLKSGRHVVALEGNSELLQYSLEFLKSEVNSRASRCEFVTRTEKSTRFWEPSTNMWFKLSDRKRNRIYEFLFLETRPRRDNDAEYMRRKEHMLAVLDNYHDASRKNAKNFLERLECLYFVESEQVLKLESYGALISTDDEAETGVVFYTATPEEDSDNEDIDIDYHPAPVFDAPGSSSAGPSTGQATQASPVLKYTPGKTPSKLAARQTPWPATPPPLRPGSSVPLHHPSRKDDALHFEGLDHTRSSEADWGHDMIWHPGTIQPAIQKGEWIMALNDDQGLWQPYPRLSKAEYLELARISVLDKVRSANPEFQPGDPAVDSTSELLFQELQDKQWLEVSDEFFELDTSPSKGRVDWKLATTEQTGGGTHVGVGERASGFEMVLREFHEWHGRSGGEQGEGGEEREEKKEWEEGEGGEEGQEGGDGEEGEEGGEGEEGEEGDGMGEKGDIHSGDERLGNEDDVDDDATTMEMEMETEAVGDLSADLDEYEVQPLTAAVNLQHGSLAVSAVVSSAQRSQELSVVEVIHGILGDEQVVGQRSVAPVPDDRRAVTTFVPSNTVESPPSSTILAVSLTGCQEGDLGGRQHVTSPKKSRVGTQALDVLALPAPKLLTKERRDKVAGKQ
ncbi:hypothetical protein CBR_g8088 [Chara braunii]|uniref:Uncharacterized protein n=1 Tax=Chara braunii TaxID=69332 RepID=A0A388KL50_CHABU|nr:hypothetical protein CBR_g8088 [Chara braunii]|eukprot:GBG70789.1 hypothetical protein CBR_g8088 [Chara braunii]